MGGTGDYDELCLRNSLGYLFAISSWCENVLIPDYDEGWTSDSAEFCNHRIVGVKNGADLCTKTT